MTLFPVYPYVGQEILLLIGYILLHLLLTCNPHGRYVRVKYEQELSLILKNLTVNLVMTIFLLGATISDSIGTTQMIARKMLLLSLFQILTLSVFFVFENHFRYVRSQVGICIYDEKRPECGETKWKNYLSLKENSMKMITEQICACDMVYLYDIAAEYRNDLIKICFENRKSVLFTAKLSDTTVRSTGLAQDGETPIFYCEGYGIGRAAGRWKRIFDVVGSALMLIILIPVFLIIAMGIRLEDGGSVFYYQTRCTEGMKEFQIIKFRSMVMGAEEQSGIQLAKKGCTHDTDWSSAS